MRREVVIENDIAWRVHSMVDLMFGKPVMLLSTAREEGRRRVIERLLDAVWEASGGIALFQDLALLGHVHGHVDLLLRTDGLTRLRGSASATRAGGVPPTLDDEIDEGRIADLAESVRIEVIEPTRGIPVLNPSDYRKLNLFVIHFERELNEVEARTGVRGMLSGRFGRSMAGLTRRRSTLTELISGDHRQVYEDDRLIEDGPVLFTRGRVPVVHIQNLSQPFRYGGLGEVEQMIPLQDELNTRLSDRASRVTMQSFKMYLAKGLDGFEKVPVGPGQIWSTDNPEAEIQSFGGDAASPSEESHIEQIREALDKVSAVPPLASGVVRAKIGNLSSANALKITLIGALSKTARKRVTYGGGISRLSRLILTAMDEAGVFLTDERDRGVKVQWPDPLPDDVREQVAAARAKVDLGVPSERVLAELGYPPTDPGVT